VRPQNKPQPARAQHCTSATKPATLAFYKIAQTFVLPLFYIYEKKRKLQWLISSEKIEEILGIKET
jgi:hypothetical protein